MHIILPLSRAPEWGPQLCHGRSSFGVRSPVPPCSVLHRASCRAAELVEDVAAVVPCVVNEVACGAGVVSEHPPCTRVCNVDGAVTSLAYVRPLCSLRLPARQCCICVAAKLELLCSVPGHAQRHRCAMRVASICPRFLSPRFELQHLRICAALYETVPCPGLAGQQASVAAGERAVADQGGRAGRRAESTRLPAGQLL